MQQGGFDAHGGPAGTQNGLADIDNALSSFTTEMILTGAWDDVVVVSASDFARTLTDNGAGTDHGLQAQGSERGTGKAYRCST